MFLVESNETDNMKSLEWAIFVLQRKKFIKNLEQIDATFTIFNERNKLKS